MKTKSRLYRKEAAFGYLFILPPVLGFLIFALYPAVYSVYGSFTDWDGLGQMNFIGLDNFKDIFQDDLFYKAMYNTLFMMLAIPVGILLALLIALGLNRSIPGTTAFRAVYYVPVISSLAAISIMWNLAYNGDFGLVNQFLDLFGIKGPNWLMDKHTVKPAIMLMMVWKGLGYTMLLYLAALQGVPKDYYEAAELDGASGFRRFWHITWPMVRPVTFFVVVTNIIGGSQVFTEVNIMTSTGGPEYSSATVVFYVWQKAFGNLQMGYASAMTVILGLFIFIVTLVQFKLDKSSDITE